MNAPKTGPKEIDLTGAFDWDNSEALTRLIPNSAAPEPPTHTSMAWKPPPSARRLEPTPKPAAQAQPRPSAPPPAAHAQPRPSAPPAAAKPRAASAPPPPPPVIAQPRAASAPPPPPPPVASKPPPKPQKDEPITAFLPPAQLQQNVPSLPAPTAPAPAKKPVSLVRVASYALVILLAAGVGLKALQGKKGRSPRAVASAVAVTATSGVALTDRPAAKARPVIETRPLDTPSVKDAAAAFARGDYREALAHYRLLAQQNPQQEAFKSLVTILERRLTPKAAP